MAFIAGKYTVTYGPSGSLIPVGQVAAGITIEHVVSKQLITGDNEGQSVQDAVYQGHNVFAELTLMEYDVAGALNMFWPYNASAGRAGVIGRLDAQLPIADHFLLTVLPGTSADDATTVQGPQTLLAERAILAEDFPVRMLFAPALRDIPLRLRFYPYDSSGTVHYFLA